MECQSRALAQLDKAEVFLQTGCLLCRFILE